VKRSRSRTRVAPALSGGPRASGLAIPATPWLVFPTACAETIAAAFAFERFSAGFARRPFFIAIAPIARLPASGAKSRSGGAARARIVARTRLGRCVSGELPVRPFPTPRVRGAPCISIAMFSGLCSSRAKS